MTGFVAVLERATKLNFSPQGYLLANLDVAKVFGPREKDAHRHFQQHGHQEIRYQVRDEFLAVAKTPSFRESRFERIRPHLNALPTGARATPVRFDDPTSPAVLDAESSHPTADVLRAELLANPNKIYADIGSGLRDIMFDNCIYVEIYPSLTTDVVIPAREALPFKDASLDGIASYAVLEHVQRPWMMAEEFARVVKPGGKIFIDWPFLQPVHGYPSHFYNATREGLKAIFADAFDVMSLTTANSQGPDFTLSWIATQLLNGMKDARLRDTLGQKTLSEIAREPPQSAFWQAVLAQLPDSTIETLACGNTLIARRKE